MVFSSAIFLFFFLPLTLGLYYLSPRRFKNLILVIVSLGFYAWGAPTFLYIFLFSCLLDYLLVINIGKFAGDLRKSKITLFISVFANVALLLYFKYTNFFIAQVNTALLQIGLESITWTKIALPIGISFFTFHKLSYSVDVFRGKSKPTKNFIDYLLYITFFPQLIAGPIVRYHEIDTQILDRQHSFNSLYEGIQRFIIGFSKKALLADPMAAVADHCFKLSPEKLPWDYAWIGLVAYSLQIYFDFSGYSDMAIGLAKMFGFKFPENFNKPYISVSITDFWRRWHMSLSRWMKDYLYIPLGGSHGSSARTYCNLWLVFIISGFWHGAEWTFVIWGVYHGFFLVIERLGLEKFLSKLPGFLTRSYAVMFACLGWVLFRSKDLGSAMDYYLALFNLHPTKPRIILPPASIISNHGIFIMVIAVFICLVIEAEYFTRVREFCSKFINKAFGGIILYTALIILFLLCVISIESTSYSPFIYFQF